MSFHIGPQVAYAEPIERLARYFAVPDSRQASLARTELARPASDDAERRSALVEALAGEVRADGSLAGGALPTIWRAHELMDLGVRPAAPSLGRLLIWITRRHAIAGAYGEGCGGDRHQRRVCEHFIHGFFSPAPPEQRIAPITMPNGKVFRQEPAARFAMSCLAFRALARAGEGARPLMRKHADTLLELQGQWTEWDGYFAPDLIVAGLHALTMIDSPAARSATARVAELVAARQGIDGEWPRADLFHVAEALLAAGTSDARAALRRAAPAFEARQRIDGSFGSTARDERALIGLRALLVAHRELLGG
ncbi:MAG: hypothetical protein H0W67_02675 [Gemmatimonadales bacterium]|nr:hypothetical protein [Gemmatimonadales bacterium]